MNIVLKPFMYIALAGFVASLVAHIGGYLGVEKPFGLDPWPLHIGIFVVWIPSVIVAQKLAKDVPQKDVWDATLRGCPEWMRRLLYGLFVYAFLSFFAFLSLDSSSANDASAVRGFSGHWLIFYYTAFVILYSATNINKDDMTLEYGQEYSIEPNEVSTNKEFYNNIGSTMTDQERDESQAIKYIGFFLLFAGITVAGLIILEVFTFFSKPEENVLVQYMTIELSKTNFATFNGNAIDLDESGAFSISVFLFAMLIWTASSISHHVIKSGLMIITRAYSADIARLKLNMADMGSKLEKIISK